MWNPSVSSIPLITVITSQTSIILALTGFAVAAHIITYHGSFDTSLTTKYESFSFSYSGETPNSSLHSNIAHDYDP